MCSSSSNRPVHLYQLLSVRDVAEILGVTERWVYQQVKQDRLPHMHVGNRVRFSPNALHDWIETQHSEF